MAKRHHEQINIGDTERLASVLGGGALIAWGLKRGSWTGFLTAAAGGALAYRGARGHCHVYEALGMQPERRSGRNVSIPYELGVRLDHEITVEKPREELYRFWRNLENLPKFMQSLESVTEIDNKHSHWVVQAPAGTSVQWKAEIVNEKENELIGWRSLPGADVANAGSVHFTPSADGRATVVKVELQYNPPGGRVAAALAKMLGRDPGLRIADDLLRFKELMEVGEISGRQVAARPASKKGWKRDVVDSASEDSFPASDPPSWTPTAGSASA